MRKIYLIRHGEPEFHGGRYCIGITDTPLSSLGCLQAAQLAYALRDEKLSVFTSPLQRARDTALAISGQPVTIDGLREMHAGEWDGLSFEEIERRWPELYLARATDPQLPIPGEENWQEGQRRFIKAVDQAMAQSRGDIAIVAHTTVILSFICHIMGDNEYKKFRYRPSYGGYYLISNDNGRWQCRFPAGQPQPEMSSELCVRLMQAAGLPEQIMEHCRAVAREALDIAAALEKAGLCLDRELICHAALLHDIARLCDDHPKEGARWLHGLGYAELADIVRQHHGPDSNEINEAAVVFIADKLIYNDKKLGLAARFEKSLEKCRDDAARAAHAGREAQARAIAAEINRICAGEIII